MNPFKTVIHRQGTDGRIFCLHWKNRHDPVTIGMVAMGAGTAISAIGTLKQGKMAAEIGKQREQVDRMKGDQAWENSRVKAEILAEKRDRLIASQKNQAAAGGIRINQGVPLVIEEETERIIGQDITSILNQGRQQKTALYHSGAMEAAVGRNARTQSRWSAVGTGLQGAGSMAWMGYSGGMFGGGGGNSLSQYNQMHQYNYNPVG
jgi:hypothetical protein